MSLFRGKIRIRFQRMNFETACIEDLNLNQGFLITETPFSDVDKSIRNMGGPRSPLYGSGPSEINEFADRYRCKCGKRIGAVFEGEECPDCHTLIEYKDIDILYTGWFLRIILS